jgi:hypothetical protein
MQSRYFKLIIKQARLVFIFFCMGNLVACSNFPKVKDFDPGAPVEVHRPIFGPRLYQNGEFFDSNKFDEVYKDNSEYLSNRRWGRVFFFTGIILSGVGGGLVGGANNSDDFRAGLGTVALGFAMARYGTSYYLDNGDLHNRILKEQKGNSVSQVSWQFSF